MIINSQNEWDPLQSVIVGTAEYANWPSQDKAFREMEHSTRWKETPIPSGAVPDFVIEQTERELEEMCNVLIQHNVDVHRPNWYNYQRADSMYGYCPRDRLLVIDDKIVNCNMRFPIRQHEIDTYDFLPDENIITVDDPEVVFDAANVLRLGDDLLYLVSDSGNLKGAKWLQATFPNKRVHVLDNIYQGVHIDSTITALNDHTVVLNGGRINEKNLPEVFKDWDCIYFNSEDVTPSGFYKYPYASKWMALNMFSINPTTVMVDRDQAKIINALEKKNFTVIPLKLSHARTLGGGFHCCTLDLWRSNDGN